MEGLERISGADVKVGAVAEANENDFESIESLVLSLIAKGSWGDVYHFFSLIEAMPYKIEIVSAQFSRSGSKISDLGSEWQGIFRLRALKFK